MVATILQVQAGPQASRVTECKQCLCRKGGGPLLRDSVLMLAVSLHACSPSLLASSVAGASGSCHCQCLEMLQLTMPAEGCWHAERLPAWRHYLAAVITLLSCTSPFRVLALLGNMLLLSRLHSSALRSIWDVNAGPGVAVKESCLLEVCARRHTYVSKT